eukprot:TRINITY_DN35481_c0_g1_i1.p1 TRINITY_DN35481_c0_g1~~TRINITY_DN35481_c0_g1_i1.p1  ORF type:complete len:511 (+),score=193.75 TRINITY_DN35481_c0_g1_i1:54-1586(+)
MPAAALLAAAAAAGVIGDFAEWVKRQGGQLADGVSFGGALTGRTKGYTWAEAGGMAATRLLYELPEEALLLAPPPDVAPAVTDEPGRLALALLLEDRRGTSSRWWPWIATLPRAAPRVGAAARQALKGTYAASVLAAAEEAAAVLCSHMLRAGAAEDCDRVNWALHVVRTHSFSAPSPGHRLDGAAFIVPGAKLAGLQPDAKLAWRFGEQLAEVDGWKGSDGTAAFRVWEVAEAPGETTDVFTHFEPAPNHRLMALLADAVEDNQADTLPLRIRLPDDDLVDRRLDLIHEAGLPKAHIIGRTGALPRDLIRLGRVAVMDGDSLQRHEDAVSAMSPEQRQEHGFFVSRKVDADALAFLGKEMQGIHRFAGGSLRDDGAAVKRRDGMEPDLWAATACRSGERLLVVEALLALWRAVQTPGALTERGDVRQLTPDEARAAQDAEAALQDPSRKDDPVWKAALRKAAESEANVVRSITELVASISLSDLGIREDGAAAAAPVVDEDEDIAGEEL